jgi:hypothetical protein
MKNLLIICLLVTTAFTSQAQEKKVEDCDCPEPTKEQFFNLCQNLYDKEPYEGPGPFGYQYQEDLWEISCADLKKDSKEIAWKKIECMWNKYREKFICYNTTSVADGKNILKFSIDSGFTVLISEFVKHNFDVNFKDPADNKTVMDFLKDQITSISNSPPVNENKIKEYQRLYNKLLTIGAKHAKDL